MRTPPRQQRAAEKDMSAQEEQPERWAACGAPSCRGSSSSSSSSSDWASIAAVPLSLRAPFRPLAVSLRAGFGMITHTQGQSTIARTRHAGLFTTAGLFHTILRTRRTASCSPAGIASIRFARCRYCECVGSFMGHALKWSMRALSWGACCGLSHPPLSRLWGPPGSSTGGDEARRRGAGAIPLMPPRATHALRSGAGCPSTMHIAGAEINLRPSTMQHRWC